MYKQRAAFFLPFLRAPTCVITETGTIGSRRLIVRAPTLASRRDPCAMNFVRGESSDYSEKGERYQWGNGRPSAAPSAASSWPPLNRGRGRGVSGQKRRRPGAGSDDDDNELDDSYFDEPDEKPAAAAAAEDDDPLEAYMAQLEGRGSSSSNKPPPQRAAPPINHAAAAADDDDDPLDAYMAGLEKAKPPPSSTSAAPTRRVPLNSATRRTMSPTLWSGARRRRRRKPPRPIRTMPRPCGRASARQGRQSGRPANTARPRHHHLPALREEPPPTQQYRSDAEVSEQRTALGVRCAGFDVPRPIQRFEHAGLTRELMLAVKGMAMRSTAIQAQSARRIERPRSNRHRTDGLWQVRRVSVAGDHAVMAADCNAMRAVRSFWWWCRRTSSASRLLWRHGGLPGPWFALRASLAGLESTSRSRSSSRVLRLWWARPAA